jgi:hypothetical protein
MISKKITFKVFIEVLSIDSIPALLQEVAEEVLRENTSGHLNQGDGDSTDWGYEEQQVTI